MMATIVGEELELCPERAVYWARRRMLFVADPHFAKAASLRASGVYVPRGTTNESLVRLSALIARVLPERVVFLGDFLHAKEGRNEDTFDAITAWRALHADIDMTLVRGNHDRRAGDPPDCVRMTCVDAPLIEHPFALVHHPGPVTGSYVLAGHVHPAAVLVGRGKQRERLPCFWFGSQVGVLPAFGEFTGLAEVAPEAGDQVWVVAGDEVVRAAR